MCAIADENSIVNMFKTYLLEDGVTTKYYGAEKIFDTHVYHGLSLETDKIIAQFNKVGYVFDELNFNAGSEKFKIETVDGVETYIFSGFEVSVPKVVLTKDLSLLSCKDYGRLSD